MAVKQAPAAAETRLDGSAPEPFCANCGAPLPVGGLTCLRCGQPIARVPVIAPETRAPAPSVQAPVADEPKPERRRFNTMYEALNDALRSPEEAEERHRFMWFFVIVTLGTIGIVLYIHFSQH